jgi:parallel beta-helix repeat protein
MTVFVELHETTSPTCGIQEAIDTLGERGGVVELPAGEFPLRRSIQLRPGVTLRGQGAATVLKLPPLRVFDLAQDLQPHSHELHLLPEHGLKTGDQLCILEPRGNRWYNSRYAVVQQASGGTVTTSLVYGKPEATYRVSEKAAAMTAFPALLIAEAADVCVQSLLVQGPGSGPAVVGGIVMSEEFMHMAVNVHRSPRCRLRDLTVRQAVTDGICVGGGASDVLVTGCIAEHCGGIGLHTGGGIKGAQFIGNISRHNRSGFLFCQGNRHVIVSGNLVHHNQAHGIWGLDANDQANIVSDNVCHHNGHHGIEAAASVNNVIRGNVCRNNSTAEPGRYAGIYLRAATGTVVQGNLCYDDQETPTQTRGVVNEEPKGQNLITDNHELPR